MHINTSSTFVFESMIEIVGGNIGGFAVGYLTLLGLSKVVG